MANTFLLAQGKPVGKSLADPTASRTPRRIMAAANGACGLQILPTDVVIAKEVTQGRSTRPSRRKVSASWHIVDVGRSPSWKWMWPA